MGFVTFGVSASFKWPRSQLFQLIWKNLSVFLTGTKFVILCDSEWISGFFFAFNRNVWCDSPMMHLMIWVYQIIWNQANLSLPRCLTADHIHEDGGLASLCCHQAACIQHWHPGQMGRFLACSTNAELNKKQTKKTISKLSYVELCKHSLWCCAVSYHVFVFPARKCCTMFVTEERRRSSRHITFL